jgi:D-amino-acid dehydrogenase
MRVIVIGAGLAGFSVAWYLRERGADVAVLERNAGPGLECSFANAALQHPSMAEPWNSPGVLALLLRNLGRSDSHMLIRLGVLPQLIGWGAHFIRESRAERHFANTGKNVLLARYSAGLMGDLRERASLEYGAYMRGSLQVFRNDRVAASTLAWVRRLAAFGLEHRTLTVAQLVAEEPALGRSPAPSSAGCICRTMPGVMRIATAAPWQRNCKSATCSCTTGFAATA